MYMIVGGFIIVFVLLMLLVPSLLTSLFNKSIPTPNLQGVGGVKSVTLTWDSAGSDITNYSICRGVTNGGEKFLKEVGNVTTYTDYNITSPGTYFYWVFAINPTGESAHSNEINATPIFEPGTPQTLTYGVIYSGIELNWSAPISNGGGAITTYNIYRGFTTGSESIDDSTDNVTSYFDSNVVPGNNYYYYVKAKNAAGEGPQSGEINVTFYQAPGAPQNLVLIPIFNGTSLSWNTPLSNGGLPIIGYKIYKGTATGNELYYHSIGNVTSFNDSILQPPNGPLFYYVTAFNNKIEGMPSDEVNGTPITCPSAPWGLEITQSGATIILEWQPPDIDGQSPITNYEIYRSNQSGEEGPIVSIGNVLFYSDPNVSSGLTYYYQISAINAIGVSNQSTEISLLFKGAPGAPQNLTATSSNLLVQLIWKAPFNDGGVPITNYEIFRSTESGQKILVATIGNELTFTDINVSIGQQYFYEIKAVNSMGESVASIEVSVLVGFPYSWCVYAGAIFCIGLVVVVKRRTRVAFVGSQPIECGINEKDRLKYDTECRIISEKLDKRRLHTAKLIFKIAASYSDIQHVLLEKKPHILHISAHGSDRILLMEDEKGSMQPINLEAFVDLVRTYGKNLKCVIMNTCESSSIAKSLSNNIPFTVGITGKVEDPTAIAFSEGFYSALANGKKIFKCIELGLNKVNAQYAEDLNKYQIWHKGVQFAMPNSRKK